MYTKKMVSNRLLLLPLLILCMPSIGFAEPQENCHQEKLDALAAHYQCQESKAMSLCRDNVNFSLAGSFFLIPPNKNSKYSFSTGFIKLRRVGNNLMHTGTSKVSKDVFHETQDILHELETKRRKMDADLKEFSKVFAEEVEKKVNQAGGKLRLNGGREPTLRNYFLAVQNEISARIPDNTFTNTFKKGAKSPGDMIQRTLEQTVLDRYPDSLQKSQRPSVEKFISLQRDRYDYRFLTNLKKRLPDLPLKSSANGHLSTLLGEELQSYRRFRSSVLNMNASDAQYESIKNRAYLESSRNNRSCELQSRNPIGRASVGLAFAGLSNFAMSATKKISSVKSLQDCTKKMNLNLSAENFEYLSQASHLEAGLIGGANCENIRFDPQLLQKIIQRDDLQLNQFLCQMHDQLYEEKNPYDEHFPEGIQWTCDGRIIVPGNNSASASQLNKNELQIQTSKGSLVRIPLKSVGEWQFEMITSDNGNLQQHFFDKIRQPFISQDSRKTQFSLEFACQSKSVNAMEMCEIARHLEAAKNIRSVCH